MNSKSIDLNLLAAFDVLMAERHVSRAAARLGITQPAMSNTLARLRHVFGDPLLVRAGRSMVLTARAQELSAPIRQGIDMLDNAIGRAGQEAGDRTFVIGTTEYAEKLLLPQLVCRLRKAVPAVPGVLLLMRRLPTLFQAPEDDLQ